VIWQCACGIENRREREKCDNCGWTKAQTDEYMRKNPGRAPEANEKISIREIPNEDLPSVILEAKDPREIILWVGKPESLLPFLAAHNQVPFLYIIAIIFLGSLFFGPAGLLMAALFVSPIALPIVMTIGAFNKTVYAVSDRRLIIRSGWIKEFTKTFDYDQISNITLSSTATERNAGVASFHVADAGTGFLAIRNAAALAAAIKSLMVDVKTDWNYPNAKRPKKNRGYETAYSIGNDGRDENP